MTDNYDKMHGLLNKLGGETPESTAFFKISVDLLGVFDLKTNRWSCVSDSWKDVLGWDPLEVLDMDLDRLVHSEDLARDYAAASAGLLDYYKALSSRAEAHITRNRHKDGHYVEIDWSGVLDVESGKVYCVGRPISS